MTDDQIETADGDASDDAAPPDAPELRLNVDSLLERIEERVSETVRQELGSALASLTEIRDTLGSVTVTLARLETRVEVLEENTASRSIPELLPPPRSPQVVPQDHSAALQLMEIERRLIEVDDNTTREILDALVSVAQHLEAVQTATAWSIVRELRSR